jgi:ribosomal protein S27E
MDAQAQAAPATFPCPGCGGPMNFDSASQSLKCPYCGNEQAIEPSAVRPVEHDFDPAEEDEAEQDAAATDWGLRQQTIHCENCGGETIIPALQTAGECVFCGSPKVLAQGDKASLRPETIIPFQISQSDAVASFRRWKRKRWFVPNAFKKGDIQSKLTGIYIPFWTYDAETSSDYSAERGDYHYRTVTKTRVVNGKTETYTETERYTVWHRVSGEYDRSFDDILIPASGQYENELLERLGDFDLNRLTGYKPEYLSGYIAERYSITRRQGWERAREKIDATLEDEIRSEIGGDEIRGLRVRTSYYDRTYKHILLPVWNANYKYKGRTYRFMVNGQTGLVSGHAPRSAVKITFFVLFCIAVAAIVLLFLMQSSE